MRSRSGNNGACLRRGLLQQLAVSPGADGPDTVPERNDEELRSFLDRHLIPGLGLGASDEA